MPLFSRAGLLAATDRRFRVAGALLLAVLIADLTLLATGYFQRQSLDAKQRRLDERVSELAALRIRAENAAAVLGKSRRIKAFSQRMNRPVTQSDIVSSLFELAGRAGVEVRDQSFMKAGPGPNGPASIAQTLVVTGRYRQVRRFVGGIEESERGINVVEQCEISADEGGRVAARLTLKTYGGAAAGE